MGNDLKKEARRQYVHYFRFWFIGIGIVALLCLALWSVKNFADDVPRTNNDAPAERVYDYADVLTDREEEELRQYIAQMEKKMHIDIVLVTINQSVEGREAMEQYGLRSTNWEQNMQDLADDFWDQNEFGYNKGFEGDGVLLLHNWYEGQNGEQLSTSGRVEQAFSYYDIEKVFDAVDRYYATNPYKAYKAYVSKVCHLLDDSPGSHFSWVIVFVLPILAAFVYAISHASQKKAKNTVAVNAYVAGGRPLVKDKSDTFVTKRVTTRRIESSQGNGRSGGGGHSGGAGHHRSSSGASHGGGSRRH